jgi:hypothetical protein
MTKLFTLFALIIAITANSQSLKTLSNEQQLEDVEFIKTELEKLHPGIYTYQTRKEFEDGFISLKENLHGNQTVFDFYNTLVPIINQIGCGHTTSKIPLKELRRIQKTRKYLPIEIKIIENKIYISKVLVESKSLAVGLEILSINNVSASQYIKSNLNRYPSDGRILSRKYQNLEKNFSIDYSRFHYTSGNFKIEVEDKGRSKTETIAGISYGDFEAKTNHSKLDEMELKLMDSISTAIITIRDSKSKKTFNDFLENSFSKIRINKISHLIIDVRYDSFNRDSDGAELFSYLTAESFRYYDKLEVTKNYDVPKALRWLARYPIEQDSLGKYYWKIHQQLELQISKPNPFLGEVFILTDGFTFSATSEFSSKIKSTKRGIFIGLETGGSYYGNNSGGMLRKVLPHSGIIVFVPPIHYFLDVNDIGDYSRGIIPDIIVNEKVNNLILNHDLIEQAAINLIQER